MSSDLLDFARANFLVPVPQVKSLASAQSSSFANVVNKIFNGQLRGKSAIEG